MSYETRVTHSLFPRSLFSGILPSFKHFTIFVLTEINGASDKRRNGPEVVRNSGKMLHECETEVKNSGAGFAFATGRLMHFLIFSLFQSMPLIFGRYETNVKLWLF